MLKKEIRERDFTKEWFAFTHDSNMEALSSIYYFQYDLLFHPAFKLKVTGRNKQKKRITDMAAFLREQPAAILVFIHTLLHSIIKIFPNNRFC